MSNERINLYIDPAVESYDTTNTWKTTAGAPTGSATKITYNADSSIGLKKIFKGDVNFVVSIPTVPTAGDVRYFGLEQITAGVYINFQIVDDVFSCECKYNGITTNIPITWNSDWTATKIAYKIRWTGFSAEFLINNVQVGFISDGSVSKIPLSLSVSNENADAMDISYIELQNVQGYL